MIAPPDYTLYSKHNTYYGTNGIRIRPPTMTTEKLEAVVAVQEDPL